MPVEQTSNEIKTIIKSWMDDKTDNLHTALPGRIISFASGSNRASVQPVGSYKAKDERRIPYPVIYNVPVVFPTGNGGSAGITFPISAGDGCLLIFAEDNLEDFLSGGDSDDTRKHSLNDAVCIPGLYSGGSTANAGDNGNVVIYNGSCRMTITQSGIEVTGGIKVSGDVVAAGISLDRHVHGGVESGGSTTSGPK